MDWLKALKHVRPTWKPPVNDGDIGEFSITTEKGATIVDFQSVIANIGNLTKGAKLRFLLVLDEFQEIANIPQAEAKLRDSLQNLNADTPVVVLGSKQHLLAGIFNSPTAPFNSWGTTLELREIPYDAYHKYIAGRLKHAGKTIDEVTSRFIQDLMDRIPECINRFCDFLAEQPDTTRIDEQFVKSGLTRFLDQTLSIYSQQYASFTARQRLVLHALAKRHHTQSVLTQDFIAAVGGVSKSGIDKIITRLLDDAVIYRIPASDGNLAYIIADPLLRSYIYRYKLLLD
jgi:DNA-binding MarR family transcriptional regulator